MKDVSTNIIRATQACILEHGLGKISMQLVAEAAGCSRRNLYQYFPDKDTLFAKVFEYNAMQKVVHRVRSHVEGFSVEDALFEGARLSLQINRRDKLAMEFMYKSGASWFQKQMLDKTSPLYKVNIDMHMFNWKSFIDQAREEGKINPNVSTEQLMEWFMHLQYILIIALKADKKEIDFTLKNLIIPSILQSPPS